MGGDYATRRSMSSACRALDCSDQARRLGPLTGASGWGVRELARRSLSCGRQTSPSKDERLVFAFGERTKAKTEAPNTDAPEGRSAGDAFERLVRGLESAD